MRYGLKYSGTRSFCPLKIKNTQFPNGFRPKFLWDWYNQENQLKQF